MTIHSVIPPAVDKNQSEANSNWQLAQKTKTFEPQ